MEGLLRAFNMLMCPINFPRRICKVSVPQIWVAMGTPTYFLKRRIVMNLLAQVMTASTGTSILRSNSSTGKSSPSIARLKKQSRFWTVSRIEEREQRCTHTWEGKKNEMTETKMLTPWSFCWRGCCFSVFFVCFSSFFALNKYIHILTHKAHVQDGIPPLQDLSENSSKS